MEVFGMPESCITISVIHVLHGILLLSRISINYYKAKMTADEQVLACPTCFGTIVSLRSP
jgi:hypothetical protein